MTTVFLPVPPKCTQCERVKSDLEVIHKLGYSVELVPNAEVPDKSCEYVPANGCLCEGSKYIFDNRK